MKAKLYVYLLLTAVISVFTISGCDKAFEAEPAATIDETVITSTATIKTTAITTSAPTETTVGETTSAPKATTAAEEVTEAIEVNQNSENTQKPDNTSDNANSNATSNTEKPKPKPAETKPKETQPPATEAPAVITDDTPLTFEEMNTEEMMQRMCEDANAHFASLGMTYDDSLDPSWSGWFYGWQGGNEYTAVRSYNQNSSRNITGIQNQVDAIFIEYRGNEYTDYRFKTTYELTDRGTYSIIFCYG